MKGKQRYTGNTGKDFWFLVHFKLSPLDNRWHNHPLVPLDIPGFLVFLHQSCLHSVQSSSFIQKIPCGVCMIIKRQ